MARKTSDAVIATFADPATWDEVFDIVTTVGRKGLVEHLSEGFDDAELEAICNTAEVVAQVCRLVRASTEEE